MREIRLLYVISGLGPGGAEQSLAELLPIYLANGIRPVIVCLRKKDRGVETVVRNLGCEVRLLPARGLTARVRMLRNMLGTEPTDLIHTTLFWSDIVGRLAAVGTGIPVLTSLVNTTYDPERQADPNLGWLSLWALRALDGWTARNLTTHFHAITHAVKDSAVRTLRIPPERVTVVERGRDRGRIGEGGPERRAESRRRLGLPADAEVVVNVARQEYQKGQKHLLEAVGLLARERPRLVLVVAGREGHSSRELSRIRVGLGLGERVRFLGHREDAPDIMAAADVFAFPSVYEGLGGAVIEAMALGLPVVASDLPALREVVEHGRSGLLVEPGSAAALAKGLSSLLDAPGLAAAFGARGRQIFIERFTIERSASGMIDLYRRVTASRRESAQARQLAAGRR